MKEYLNNENGKSTFIKKTVGLKKTINEAIFIIDSFETPIAKLTSRRLERMALCLMALANVKKSSDWKKSKSMQQGVSMKSRDIIKYINLHLQDKISSGSYDDIRRKDLKLLVLDGIVVNTKPFSARNDSTRGYAISEAHANIIRGFGRKDWLSKVKRFIKYKPTLAQQLSEERNIRKVPITLPNGIKLKFSPGMHNKLQKTIIEEFLPRFGYGAEILYIGDAADRFLYKKEDKLKKLNFFEMSHGELPDIVAYSASKKWLFLIEAVHASGTVSKMRYLELKKLTQKCKADIIYVTAFMDKATFRKFAVDIAWETEVWIAESPDHMIHFDGEKFLGPYKGRTSPC